MFKLENGKWKAVCDRCGQAINTGQTSFQQASIYLSRAEGWESFEHCGDWRNYCPKCIEDGGIDLDSAGIGFTRKPISDDDY